MRTATDNTCPLCNKPVRYLKHSILCGCGARFKEIRKLRKR